MHSYLKADIGNNKVKFKVDNEGFWCKKREIYENGFSNLGILIV